MGPFNQRTKTLQLGELKCSWTDASQLSDMSLCSKTCLISQAKAPGRWFRHLYAVHRNLSCEHAGVQCSCMCSSLSSPPWPACSIWFWGCCHILLTAGMCSHSNLSIAWLPQPLSIQVKAESEIKQPGWCSREALGLLHSTLHYGVFMQRSLPTAGRV